MKYNPSLVKFIREQYPPGTRIRLTEMQNPYVPVPPGTEEEVDFIDDAAQIHMKWSNGRSLALIPGVDRFTVIPQPLQTLKLYMPLNGVFSSTPCGRDTSAWKPFSFAYKLITPPYRSTVSSTDGIPKPKRRIHISLL